MIEKIGIEKAGFAPALNSDTWRVCFVTAHEQYGELRTLKRHNDTDEAFVLLSGRATLYKLVDGKIEKIDMEREYIYNIQRSTWHHLQIHGDAKLIAIENRDVSTANTERMDVNL